MNAHSLSSSHNKFVAVILAATLMLWSAGFALWTSTTQAADLTSVSDLLSDSDLGVVSNHTITFTNPTAVAAGETITVNFADAGWNVSTSSVDNTDIDYATTTGDYTLSTGGCAADDMDVGISGQIITFTLCTGTSVPANSTSTIEIGTHATFEETGDQQLVNPNNAGSYEIQIGGTQTDSANTRVAIIDDVLVTASVDTIFTFVINGIATSSSVNGSPTTTAAASTATTLPFGTLAVGISKTLAQNLQVTTNARNGFTVTLNQNQNLLSSTGADIDRFTDDTGVSSTTAWVGPNGTLGTENEYGHMGITSEDETLGDTDLTTHFYDDLWAGNFVNNPREVFYNDGPADGSATGIGSTTVGFQAEIMAFQEAGTDYQATITYVATPVF